MLKKKKDHKVPLEHFLKLCEFINNTFLTVNAVEDFLKRNFINIHRDENFVKKL